MGKNNNKLIKNIAIVLCIIVLLLILAGCVITALIYWFFGGVRFSPEAALEAYGKNSSKQERVEADDCYFYYRTVGDDYENAGDLEDYICSVTSVRKNGIGMWYATPEPNGDWVYVEGTSEPIGGIRIIEVNGQYHNFFILSFEGNEPVMLPDGGPTNYDTVTVDGCEIELFKHSYFVTDAEVEEFEIDGLKLVVGEY